MLVCKFLNVNYGSYDLMHGRQPAFVHEFQGYTNHANDEWLMATKSRYLITLQHSHSDTSLKQHDNLDEMRHIDIRYQIRLLQVYLFNIAIESCATLVRQGPLGA